MTRFCTVLSTNVFCDTYTQNGYARWNVDRYHKSRGSADTGMIRVKVMKKISIIPPGDEENDTLVRTEISVPTELTEKFHVVEKNGDNTGDM